MDQWAFGAGKTDAAHELHRRLSSSFVFDPENVGKLRDDGITAHHYELCASHERLLERLRSRGEGETSWAARQMERCTAGLSHEEYL